MRRPRKSINQINVVPYIDVMLVLLVIFMVTAPLVAPGEIELPSVGSRLTVPAQPLRVTLNTDGRQRRDRTVARGPRRAHPGEAGEAPRPARGDRRRPQRPL
jgi:biopolymer transport protein TolR